MIRWKSVFRPAITVEFIKGDCQIMVVFKSMTVQGLHISIVIIIVGTGDNGLVRFRVILIEVCVGIVSIRFNLDILTGRKSVEEVKIQ